MGKLFSFKKQKSDTQDGVFRFGGQDEKVILRHLQNYYDEALKATKSRREKWKIHYKYWVNSMVSDRRPSYKSDIRVNYCWVTTEVKLPFMTQNMPRVNFISFEQGPEAEERAERMSKLVGNALWHKLEINFVSDDSCWDAMVYDAGFYKVGYDPDAEDGVGELFATSVEPFKTLPDPYTKNHQKGRYFIHIEPYPVDELRAMYPKYANQIGPDKAISQILFEERKFAERTPTARSGIVTEHTQFETERAFKKEYWLSPKICDQKVIEEGEQDPKTGEVEKLPKYRLGRMITTINDAVIIEDKPNPYAHGKFPFVQQIMHKVGNELWGMGDIEQVIPLQDALNHAYQQLDDIISQTANIGWTVDPSLGEKNIRELAKKLGIPGVLKVVPLDKIRADVPGQVPQYLVTRIQDIIQRIYEITGISEILQGSGRVTHRTARGIERLFEAGTTRIGKSIQYYERALQEVALMMAALVNQFYTEDRVHAIIGGNGQLAGTLKTPAGSLKGKYEVTIDSGAALPRDKQSRADLVFNLLQNHVFEMALSPNPIMKAQAKVVLDAVEFPGREALLNFKTPQAQPPVAQSPPQGMAAPPAGALPMPAAQAGPQAAGGAPDMAAIMEMAAQAGIPPEQFIQMISQGLSQG